MVIEYNGYAYCVCRKLTYLILYGIHDTPTWVNTNKHYIFDIIVQNWTMQTGSVVYNILYISRTYRS